MSADEISSYTDVSMIASTSSTSSLGGSPRGMTARVSGLMATAYEQPRSMNRSPLATVADHGSDFDVTSLTTSGLSAQ